MIRMLAVTLSLVAAFAIPAAAVAQTPAGAAMAETVRTAVGGAGLSMTQAQCAAVDQAAWVSVMGRNICMRYYLSTAGGNGPRPVVFLQGDWSGPPRDVSTNDYVKAADRLSKLVKTPAIYLARMGRDGSSGSHDQRHTMLELMATNAAMEAIKQRHRYEGFHLEGHSGGGNLVAGLLGLRRDIACAVPADGQLERSSTKVSDPALDLFNPADEIPAIARNQAARILVVTDPQDLVVRIENQLPFVEKLRKAGGKVEVFYVDSGGDEHADHHFTTPHADLVMRDCVRGASYEEIAADTAELVAKRLKDHLAALKAKEAVQSPAAPPAPAADRAALSPKPGNLLAGTDLRGADYSNFLLDDGEPILCQAACRSDDKCAAWTYVKPRQQGGRARCWLKAEAPAPVANSCCTSGIERLGDKVGQ